MLSVAVPIAASALLVLGGLTLHKLCSVRLLFFLGAAFVGTLAAEIVFGVWFYQTSLPGHWRDLVWWLRWL
jgi:hypothetical protein